MKQLFVIPAFVLLAACASVPDYGPAASSTAYGYAVQPIETGRYRVSYTDKTPAQARDYALLRAAEVTLETGGDWFQVVNGYTEADPNGGTRSSISIGGGSGSYGRRSGVGVGLGVGIPLGGGGGKVTHGIEILTGNGPKPAGADIYDARQVQTSLAGVPN